MSPWRCKGCDTELTIAGSTFWKMLLLPLLPVIPMMIFRKELGKGGLIALGIIVAETLPLLGMYLFFAVESTGRFELNRPERPGDFEGL